MSPSGVSQMRIGLNQWFSRHTNIIAYWGQGSHSEKVMMNISGFTDSRYNGRAGDLRSTVGYSLARGWGAYPHTEVPAHEQW
jgi:hypothetical protein